MAFELWAESEDNGSAERLAAHFADLKDTLLHGKRIRWPFQ